MSLSPGPCSTVPASNREPVNRLGRAVMVQNDTHSPVPSLGMPRSHKDDVENLLSAPSTDVRSLTDNTTDAPKSHPKRLPQNPLPTPPPSKKRVTGLEGLETSGYEEQVTPQPKAKRTSRRLAGLPRPSYILRLPLPGDDENDLNEPQGTTNATLGPDLGNTTSDDRFHVVPTTKPASTSSTQQEQWCVAPLSASGPKSGSVPRGNQLEILDSQDSWLDEDDPVDYNVPEDLADQLDIIRSVFGGVIIDKFQQGDASSPASHATDSNSEGSVKSVIYVGGYEVAIAGYLDEDPLELPNEPLQTGGEGTGSSWSGPSSPTTNSSSVASSMSGNCSAYQSDTALPQATKHRPLAAREVMPPSHRSIDRSLAGTTASNTTAINKELCDDDAGSFGLLEHACIPFNHAEDLDWDNISDPGSYISDLSDTSLCQLPDPDEIGPDEGVNVEDEAFELWLQGDQVSPDFDETEESVDGQKPFELKNFGGQPIRPQILSFFFPRQYLARIIRKKIRGVYKTRDLGSYWSNEEVETKAILQALRLDPGTPDTTETTVLCSYTGKPVCILAGARSSSLEAAYTVVFREGKPALHGYPNVYIISDAANRLKYTWAIVMPALIAETLNLADHDVSIDERKGRILWLFIALYNIGIASLAYQTARAHDHRREWWSTKSLEEVREGLTMLRTGTRSNVPLLEQHLESLDLRHLLLPKTRQEPYPIDIPHWKKTVLEMALHHGFSAAEFEELFTIPSPDGTGWIFFPWHPCSRTLATRLGWNWQNTYAMAVHHIQVSNAQCNRHARAAGFVEEGVTPENVLYWMALHFCLVAKDLRERNPGISIDALAWTQGDRWKIPIVPFRHHPWKASVCKRQTHGIAIEWGFQTVEAGQKFHPLRHIRMDRSTITIDAGCTNRAMFKYAPEDWDSIRWNLRYIPLKHTLWAVDPELGNTFWREPTLAPALDPRVLATPDIHPIPPVPAFDMPLRPINDWIQSSRLKVSLERLQCCHCEESFDLDGELVAHCREKHDHGMWDLDQVEDLQAGVVEGGIGAYIRKQNRVQCLECGDWLCSASSLKRHVEARHMELEPWVCGEDGCLAEYTLERSLKKHKRVVHGIGKGPTLQCSYPHYDREFEHHEWLLYHIRSDHKQLGSGTCEYCGKRFKTSKRFKLHQLREHPPPDAIIHSCPSPGCPRQSTVKEDITQHWKDVHRDGRLICDVCGDVLSSRRALQRHIDARHKA